MKKVISFFISLNLIVHLQVSSTGSNFLAPPTNTISLHFFMIDKYEINFLQYFTIEQIEKLTLIAERLIGRKENVFIDFRLLKEKNESNMKKIDLLKENLNRFDFQEISSIFQREPYPDVYAKALLCTNLWFENDSNTLVIDLDNIFPSHTVIATDLMVGDNFINKIVLKAAYENIGILRNKKLARKKRIRAALNILTDVFGFEFAPIRLEALRVLKEFQQPDDNSPFQNKVDFHCHTNYSDAFDTPSMLIYRAWIKGIKIIGITDHDSFAGTFEAIEAGRILGIEVIPGIELYSEADPSEYKTLQKRGKVEIVTYFPDTNLFKNLFYVSRYEQSLKNIAKSGQRRVEWLRQMAQRFNEKYNKHGLIIPESSLVKAMRGCFSAGRIQLGYAMTLAADDSPQMAKIVEGKTPSDLWREYFFVGKPSYIDMVGYSMNPFEAVTMGIMLGGVPVLAHPSEYKYVKDGLNTSHFLLELLNSIIHVSIGKITVKGCYGVEIFYKKDKPETIKLHKRTVEQFVSKHRKTPLFFSVGGDDHGVYSGDLLAISCPDAPLLYEHITMEIKNAQNKILSQIKLTSKNIVLSADVVENLKISK